MAETKIELLNDGDFRLDGGAMFGIVPKPLWSRLCPPDALNRIPLRTGMLLIRTPGANVLVDAGFGTKLTDRQKEIYAFGQSGLERALAERNLAPEAITHVVLTHLHIDHAGGCTRFAENKRSIPVFPNAEYLVQAQEWEAACSRHPLTRGSYAPEDFMPLKEQGQLTLLDGNRDIGHGIALVRTGGHSPGHQIVVVEAEGRTAVFFGDLVPTAHHVRLPYVMAYDACPLDVVLEKDAWIQKALKGSWRVFLQHDPAVASGTLQREGKAIVLLPDQDAARQAGLL